MTYQPDIAGRAPWKVVAKGWGHEVWLYNADGYCMKALSVEPGSRCSLHFHRAKTETWLAVAGELDVEVVDTCHGDSQHHPMRPGDWLHINPGVPHRFTNNGALRAIVIEASSIHADADSYRIAPGDSQQSLKTPRSLLEKQHTLKLFEEFLA